MDVYKVNSIAEQIERGNPYCGRGIVIGKTADGTKACAAYFIMGRSANSRNRIFTEKDGAVYTEPFDASKVEDPSLIIYAAIRKYENKLNQRRSDGHHLRRTGSRQKLCRGADQPSVRTGRTESDPADQRDSGV